MYPFASQFSQILLSSEDRSSNLDYARSRHLPNLHMLEIAWAGSVITAPLKKVLKRVKPPRIKTFILPPTAHPLRHCHNVEDIVCVLMVEP